MLLRTFYCLKSLGLSDEDLINNLGVFEQYGGFSDEEILHNVERFFYKTIDPARRKIIFYSQLTGLGDSVIVTGIIREIKRVCPSALIDARTVHENLFLYNPHVEKLDVMAADVELCILSFNHKRLSTADMLLARFKNRIHYAFLMHLLAQSKLGLSWDCKNIKPDLHLGNTLNPVRSELEFSGPYWLINSGFQNTAPEKWYPHYQKVVDLLRGKVQFIQHGGPKDTHGRLNGVLSIAGQTSPLELAAAFRDCAGSLGGPGSHLHFAAAFDRPCVVISGGQEHPESINYENQQTLFKDIGCEKVLSGNLRGCGHRGKYGKSCCPHFLGDHAACMDAIAPEEVADAILKYQRGNL
jgi:ADP-heptose:LPS heptosyltransferase